MRAPAALAVGLAVACRGCRSAAAAAAAEDPHVRKGHIRLRHRTKARNIGPSPWATADAVEAADHIIMAEDEHDDGGAAFFAALSMPTTTVAPSSPKPPTVTSSSPSEPSVSSVAPSVVPGGTPTASSGRPTLLPTTGLPTSTSPTLPSSHPTAQPTSPSTSPPSTLATTDATVFDAAECPARWTPRGVADPYIQGDLVSMNYLIYRCRPTWPESLHCGQVGYDAPDPSVRGDWKQIWELVGFCSSIAGNLETCPSAYGEGAKYDVGDRVAATVGWTCALTTCAAVVYECRPIWSFFCNSAWHQPGRYYDYLGWKVVGPCLLAPPTPPPTTAMPVVTSPAPTASTPSPTAPLPTSAPTPCPDPWSETVGYGLGDQVSYRGIVYSCTSNATCGDPDYDPADPTVVGLWKEAWDPVTICDQNNATACPNEFSDSADYEAGDRISYAVSFATSYRATNYRILYECRELWLWYCSDPSYAPGTDDDYLPWEVVGVCMPPAASPSPTAPSSLGTSDAIGDDCTYVKCVVAEGVEEVCYDAHVNSWDEAAGYVAGDVVRVGDRRFRCREWPASLLCTKAEHAPTSEDDGDWNDAWTLDGTCP